MKANTGNLISRATRATGRALLVVASGVALSTHYDLRPIDWPLLKDDVPIEVVSMVATTLLFFLLIAHYVNWTADRTSYTKWFTTNELSKATVYGLGDAQPSDGVVKGLGERVKQLERELDLLKEATGKLHEISLEDSEQKAAETLNKIVNKQETILKQLKTFEFFYDELPSNFSAFDKTAKFNVFVWHFGLPMAMGVAALLIQFLAKYSP